MESVVLAPAPPDSDPPLRVRALTHVTVRPGVIRGVLPLVIAATMATAWSAGFGYLAVVRHLAGGSHAEDLGFSDQVLWNFLRGQWFRMSLYDGATWNTELDVSRLLRPDSLLAFHAEPMLLGFVPLYALGGGAIALLLIQAVAVGAGALPAYRLGRHLCRSAICGVAVSAAYLLSPFGQWAVLADFHTSALAAPLLLLSLERLLVAQRPGQALLAAVVAASAREDVGPVLVCIGAVLLVRRRRRIGFAYLGLGVVWTILALIVIRRYSGGFSPFEARYVPSAVLDLVGRPLVGHYLATLVLSGGWLAVAAPLALLPALPSLALNVLSGSPWMASGQAHYSALVLPFVTLSAAAGLARLGRWQRPGAMALIATSVVGYIVAGAGPLAANYAPAVVTEHATRAGELAAALPRDAAVSATSSLVPRVSERAGVYVFPAVLEADYVFLDLQASPAPTSAADVYLRVQSLLASGEWQVQTFEDGLLVLRREAADPTALTSPSNAAPAAAAPAPRLLSAALVPSPDGALGPDGPHWILRTVWQADQALPAGTKAEYSLRLRSGEQVHVWDIASLWWDPPEHWPVGEPVTVDIPDVPVRELVSWSATWSAR